MSNARDVNGNASQPDYQKKVEKGLSAAMRDGTRLAVDVYRPDAPGRFPALLSITMYSKEVEDVQHLGPEIGKFNLEYSMVEAGDSEFWATRGYVHVIADTRGTGNSEGAYQGILSEQEAQDAYDLVEWVAAQEWCDGNVGMTGLSYLAINQYFAAAQQPPHLKTIVPHDGPADMYRDTFYHGGIPAVIPWFLQRAIAARNTVSVAKELYSEDDLRKRVDALINDEETSFGKSTMVISALRVPPETRPIIFDALVHPEYDSYWRDRSPSEVLHRITVPSYLGAEMHGQSTPVYLGGVDWGWQRISAPKKLAFWPQTTGGNHRPFYQFHDELLRWYDYWLKGIDNGVMDEPAVKVWVRGREEYRYADTWPIGDTVWTRAYLRGEGRLTLDQAPETEEESARLDYEPLLPAIGGQPLNPPPRHLSYLTDPFDTDVEIVGPLALYLQATLSGENGDFIVSVRDVSPDGSETALTRGWLRASHRELDQERSVEWKPYHPHTNPTPVTPNQRYEFAIELRPMANLFAKGHRLKLEIWPCDYPSGPNPADYDWTQFWGFIHHIPYGKAVSYQVHHDAQAPSYLLLPVMRGRTAG